MRCLPRQCCARSGRPTTMRRRPTVRRHHCADHMGSGARERVRRRVRALRCADLRRGATLRPRKRSGGAEPPRARAAEAGRAVVRAHRRRGRPRHWRWAGGDAAAVPGVHGATPVRHGPTLLTGHVNKCGCRRTRSTRLGVLGVTSAWWSGRLAGGFVVCIKFLLTACTLRTLRGWMAPTTPV